MGAFGFMGLVAFSVLFVLTYFRRWQWLWTEWLTSVDHKKIGVMYIILALVMLLRGFSDAIMMRMQLALASGGAAGYLPPEHYDQIFSAHGAIMIFFMAMPFVIGLINIVVPLQIGARDVAFPFLNSLSFWLTVAGFGLINISLGIGEFARTGWLAYPPLSELAYSPGRRGRLLHLESADLGDRDYHGKSEHQGEPADHQARAGVAWHLVAPASTG
jgi:cytochrome o ubiquinol oxidase subunit I